MLKALLEQIATPNLAAPSWLSPGAPMKMLRHRLSDGKLRNTAEFWLPFYK